jgi:uncharacterized coiled-coil protein SlyX
MDETVEERFMDLDVKLAYQERLIRDLDALVRTFGDKLDAAMREIDQLKRSIASPELPITNAKPPHY